MSRHYIDCRSFPDSKCSVAVSADREEELMQAAVEHAVSMHGYKDSSDLRKQLKTMFKAGNPPA